MKIRINQVEGSSSKKGAKQNKVYTIIGNSGIVEIRGKMHDLSHFHKAVDEKGNEFCIWDVNKNWSKIGISKEGNSRTSYTNDFEII